MMMIEDNDDDDVSGASKLLRNADFGTLFLLFFWLLIYLQQGTLLTNVVSLLTFSLHFGT